MNIKKDFDISLKTVVLAGGNSIFLLYLPEVKISCKPWVSECHDRAKNQPNQPEPSQMDEFLGNFPETIRHAYSYYFLITIVLNVATTNQLAGGSHAIGLFPLEYPPASRIPHPPPIVDFETTCNMPAASRGANEKIKKYANVRARARQPDGQMSSKAPVIKAGSAHGNNFMGGAQTKRGMLTEPPPAREMQRRPVKPRQVLRKLKGQYASGVFKEDYAINCLRTTHDRKNAGRQPHLDG